MFRPPDPLPVSKWAARFFHIDQTSPSPGLYDPTTTPWINAILDEYPDPNLTQIVLRASAQSSKTQPAIICLAWVIANAWPSNVQPALVAEPQKRGEKPLAPGGKQGRKRWAALIKQVYEVDPLSCPKCGAEMKIIAFIEGRQEAVVEKILKHCGLWNEESDRGPPQVQGRTQAETVKRR